MTDLQKAVQTQLANIEKKTGKTLAQLHAAIAKSGKTKHGEIRTWLMDEFGLGHGDANTLVHSVQAKPTPSGDVLAEIYTDKKAHLRPIHDKVMDAIKGWGNFEVAPKKGYVSLRRKKQFAMLGPKTNDRIELGLNLKDDIASKKIVAQKPGGMCQFIAPLTSPADVDKEITTALKKAFDASG
ncbi:MAG: DUF4287 domain-containing protein [Rhodospirillales bacterium]|nr:DUF4287 domain-containing protein [Rhodospirillales bacterium]